MQNEKETHWKEQLERRSSPRMSVFAPAFFNSPDPERPEGWGWIIDIGVNGMEIMTHFPMKKDQAVVITFCLDNSMTLTDVCGKVVHDRINEGYTIAGIVFDKDFDRTIVKNALQKLLEETLKQTHPEEKRREPPPHSGQRF